MVGNSIPVAAVCVVVPVFRRPLYWCAV